MAAEQARAIAPRTPHDFNLLASVAANFGVPRTMVSTKLGFDEGYADQLGRSAPGEAFSRWLSGQPGELLERFVLQFGEDNETEPAETVESPYVRDPSGPIDPGEKWLRDLGFIRDRKED
jgi:hypothetical protein